MQFKSTLYVTHGNLDKVIAKRGLEGQRNRFCIGLDARFDKFVEWAGVPKHYISVEQTKCAAVKYLSKALTSGLAGNLTRYSNPELNDVLKDDEEKLTLDFLVDQLLPVWNDLGNTYPTSTNGLKALRDYAFRKISMLRPSMITHVQEMYLKGIVSDTLNYDRKPVTEAQIIGVIKQGHRCHNNELSRHAPISTMSCRLGRHPDQIKLAVEYLVRKGDIFVFPSGANGCGDHYATNRRIKSTRRAERKEVVTSAK